MLLWFALRLRLLLLHFRVETRHVHAERHLAKAGVARRKGRGVPTLGEGAEGGTERAERSGGLHKRSAEDWGYPLRRAIGAEPLSEACLPYLARAARRDYRVGVAGGNGPLRRVAEDRRAADREETPPRNQKRICNPV